MTWGLVAVAGATLVGGALASESASDAADTQAQSSANAISEQRRQYDLTREDYAPYRTAGTTALGRLQGEMDQPFTGAEALAEPGYQFGLQQGQLALDRKAAAAGGRVSGAALKAASEYGTNYATTGYNAAYQRRQDRLNRLAALAGIGQSATGSSAAAGATAAGNITGLISGQGNAAAAGQLAQGNIWGNTANQLGAIGQKWASTPASGSGSGGYVGMPAGEFPVNTYA
jgi:hypothetical protein